MKQEVGLTAFEHELRARIAARRALADVEELVGFGDRFVGADGDRAAAAWVRERFGELGLELEEQGPGVVGGRHGRGMLLGRVRRGPSARALSVTSPSQPRAARS